LNEPKDKYVHTTVTAAFTTTITAIATPELSGNVEGDVKLKSNTSWRHEGNLPGAA